MIFLIGKEGNTLYELNEAIQKMIDWIEDNITEKPSLMEMSAHIGYSPFDCSAQFHKICGITIKSYISGRRLALVAFELRDTQNKITDIALKYGFSSQDALTRAFRIAFGCTPALYRKNPIPIPLSIRKVIYLPEHYNQLHKGGNTSMPVNARTRIEYIPAHKYIGIWDDTATNYGEFWENHDCDEVCGIIESMRNVCHPIVASHTAGWKQHKGQRLYFYGFGVADDYEGAVPEGFEIREIPASYYMVFYHPPFDYLKDNGTVMERVEDLAWNYDIRKQGASDLTLDYYDGRKLYEWNEEACQCYQRHYPEGLGYEILRPIRLRDND